jgi:hypothetical protein
MATLAQISLSKKSPSPPLEQGVKEYGHRTDFLYTMIWENSTFKKGQAVHNKAWG